MKKRGKIAVAIQKYEKNIKNPEKRGKIIVIITF